MRASRIIVLTVLVSSWAAWDTSETRAADSGPLSRLASKSVTKVGGATSATPASGAIALSNDADSSNKPRTPSPSPSASTQAAAHPSLDMEMCNVSYRRNPLHLDQEGVKACQRACTIRDPTVAISPAERSGACGLLVDRLHNEKRTPDLVREVEGILPDALVADAEDVFTELAKGFSNCTDKLPSATDWIPKKRAEPATKWLTNRNDWAELDSTCPGSSGRLEIVRVQIRWKPGAKSSGVLTARGLTKLNGTSEILVEADVTCDSERHCTVGPVRSKSQRVRPTDKH
jgi:hypothetical protein